MRAALSAKFNGTCGSPENSNIHSLALTHLLGGKCSLQSQTHTQFVCTGRTHKSGFLLRSNDKNAKSMWNSRNNTHRHSQFMVKIVCFFTLLSSCCCWMIALKCTLNSHRDCPTEFVFFFYFFCETFINIHLTYLLSVRTMNLMMFS